MNSYEVPAMEQPDASNDNAVVEIRSNQKQQGTTEIKAEQEKIVDPETGSKEYADARLKWARLDAEYNALSNEQGALAEKFIANRDDTAVLLDLKSIGLKLDEIRDRRDLAGGRSTELFFKLLEAEGGAKNADAAEALFQEELSRIIQSSPDLAGHLVAGELDTPGFAESAEKIKRLTDKVNDLAEMQVEFNALVMEMNDLDLEITRLKAEKTATENEQKELSKASERNIETLRQSVVHRQDITKQIQEATRRMDEFANKFEDLTARVRDIFME